MSLVIASDLPGVRTVVAEGADGYLVRPADPHDLAGKLKQVLGMPAAQRRALGDCGRAKVQRKYAWALIAEQLEHFYFSVLQR